MQEAVEEPLQLNQEEIKQLSRLLAEAFVQQMPKVELTVITCVSGYEIIREDQIAQVVNLDLIASATHGWTDILGQIAGWFWDVVEKLFGWIVGWIRQNVIPAITGISNWLSTVLPQIGTSLGGVASFIADKIMSGLKTISDFFTVTVPSYFKSVVDFFVKTIPSYFSIVTDFFTKTVPSLFKTVTDFFSITIPSLFKIVTDFFTKTIPDLFKMVTDFFTKTVPDLFKIVLDFFTKTMPELFKIVTDFFTKTVPELFKPVVDFFSKTLPTLFGIVVDFFSKTIPALFGIVVDFFTKTIPSLFGMVVDFFTKTMPSLFGVVVDFFSKTLPSLFSVLTDFFTKTIPSWITGISKGVTDLINLLVALPSKAPEIVRAVATAIYEKLIVPMYEGVKTYIINPLASGIQNMAGLLNNVGVAFQGFVNGIFMFPQWFKDSLIAPFTKWFEEFVIGKIFVKIESHVPYYSPAPQMPAIEVPKHYIPTASIRWGLPVFPDLEVLSDPFRWLANKIVNALSGWVDWLWGAIQGVFNALVNAVKGIAEAIWNAVTGVMSFIGESVVKGVKSIWDFFVKKSSPQLTFFYPAFVDFIHGVYDPLHESTAKEANEILKPQFEGVIKHYAPPIKIDEVTRLTINTWGVSLAFMTVPFWGQIPVRLGSWVMKALSKWLSGLDWKVRINLRPFGLGVDTEFNFAKAIGATIYDIAVSLKEWLDEIGRGTIYGYAIWFSRPISKVLSMSLRNFIPVELPREDVIMESLRRAMPLKDFEDRHRMASYFLAIQGYSDYVIDSWLKPAKDLNIKVTDRFGTARTVPLALMYELPSASDVATMMVRDIFATIDDFQRLYSARGMHPDIGALYYFLRFRYPPPERLWQFTVRGISGLLWATLPDAEKADIKKEAEPIGATMPVAPETMNFKSEQLLTAFKTYMKWHDYARFSWIKDFPSDNLIYIDTLAEVPTKIDQRWMCVPPDTIILGDNKPISEYHIGDEVLYGGKVLETFTRPFSGELIVIKGLGLLPIRVTPEHPILVVDGEIQWKYYSRDGKVIATTQKSFSKPYFVEAEKVQLAPVRSCDETYIFRRKGHHLVSPRLKGEYDIKEIDLSEYFKNYLYVPRCIREKLGLLKPKLVLDEELAWLFGFYVGDGSTSREQVEFYPSSEEHVKKIARIIERYGFKPSIIKVGKAYNVLWSSRALKRFFDEQFGNKAHEKRIPDLILLHKDERVLLAFLRGYLDADGNKAYDNPNKYEALTVSKILALQIQSLCFRLGLSCGISEKSKAQTHYTDKAYRLTIMLKRDEKHAKIKFTEDYVFVPVISISREPYDGIVCNLETERNIYLVSNAIVHNCKWGIYELLSAKQVTYTSSVKDFTKIMEATPTSAIKMDLTNFSRTVLATGLHPDWVPATAVAEAMNVLTEERTALRTGFMGLFKEGFYDIKALDTMLAGFIKTSFQVAYFDMTKMQWTTGWVNIPVMYLPPERKLLQLRALMDRSLDILREVQRDISNAYQEYIFRDYQVYKSRLTQVIEKINEYFAEDYKAITGTELPEDLELKFVEAYHKPYVEALQVWRDAFTIRRIRMWTQRWLGWVMYRVAYGVVEKGDIEKLITYVSDKAKLTDQETEFIRQVMDIMYGIATRSTVAEYLPTPSTLATLSEYITLDTKLVKEVLSNRGLDKEWQNIWLTYITVKPIKADAKALLSTYVRAFRYGVIPKEVLDKYVKEIPEYGFTEKEIQFIKESINLEEQIIEARASKGEYIPTPITLATICEYLPEAREFYDDVVVAKRIPKEWQELWARYIDIRPLVDDIKRYVSNAEALYVRFMTKKADFEKILKEANTYLGYTSKETEFLMKVTEFERYRNAWTELVGSVERLVSLSEYSPRASKYALGKLYEMIDALPLTLTEKAELKAMWEEYIHNRPVKAEAKTYITQLINAYVEGLISDDVFKKELQEMAKWGFSADELTFYEAQAALRKARKWKIPIGE